MTHGREAMLEAFARLFIKTARKLDISYEPEELIDAREAFAERMERVLDALEEAPFDVVPPAAVATMEEAIDQLSPAAVVGQLAALPLLQHSQLVLQRIAHRAAEQRLIEHALEQADTTYGGN